MIKSINIIFQTNPKKKVCHERSTQSVTPVTHQSANVRISELSKKPLNRWIPAAGIVLIAGGLSAAFAWASGWIGARPLQSNQLLDTMLEGAPHPFPPGFRRAHGKGICFAGTFQASGAASSISKARAFTQKNIPVSGRFAIGTLDPYAPDNSTRVVSMALMMNTDDHQQWRLAMNNQPYFVTSGPEGFADLLAAFKPDPSTGKPNPEMVAGFNRKHPEAKKFLEWADQAPWVNSFAGAEYFGVNSFRLISDNGQRQYVRWSMRPHTPFSAWTVAERENAAPDILYSNLRERVKYGPLEWDLVLTLASPEDNVNDPSQPWPQERQEIIAGTLHVTTTIEQTGGPCRDVNFDPTIVPTGIEISEDPVLRARSGVYAHSFNRREREIGYGNTSSKNASEVAQ